jgi:hypothetical protein
MKKQDHPGREVFNRPNPYKIQHHRTTGMKPSDRPNKNRTRHRTQGKARTGRLLLLYLAGNNRNRHKIKEDD